LTGAQLAQIPSTLETWDAFRRRHPDGRVLSTDLSPVRVAVEQPRGDWVIGLALGDHSTAVHFPFALSRRVVNTAVGPEPVLVWVDSRSRSVRAYLRVVGGVTLTFERAPDDRLRDLETGSIWDPLTGLAQTGPRAEQVLSPVPWTSSFDWAWRDFYPHARLVGAAQPD
jgi:hypothetical protein